MRCVGEQPYQHRVIRFGKNKALPHRTQQASRPGLRTHWINEERHSKGNTRRPLLLHSAQPEISATAADGGGAADGVNGHRW